MQGAVFSYVSGKRRGPCGTPVLQRNRPQIKKNKFYELLNVLPHMS